MALMAQMAQMPKIPKMAQTRRRLLFLTLVLSLSFVALEIRLFHLQVVRHPVSLDRSLALHYRTEQELASRGRILARNGQVMAESVPALDLYANSHWTVARKRQSTEQVRDGIADVLGQVLGDSGQELRSRLDRRGYRRLLRQPVDDGEQIQALLERKRAGDLPGIELERTWTRRYPEGPLAAHVIGFCNTEGRGQIGIEQRFDELLSSRSGKRKLRCDAGRRPLPGLDAEYTPARPGADVRLTIDLVIQFFVEEALDQITADHRPNWAAAVVLDPNNGDLLALASRPGFDPNSYGGFPQGHFMNRAVSYFYRPGSSFKPIMMGIILEAAAVRLDEKIDCRAYNDRGRVIRDSHPNGYLTPAEIIIRSSNIGMSKLALRLVPDHNSPEATRQAGFRRVRTTLTRLGCGQKPGLGLPAVTAGMLPPLSKWTRKYTLPSLSFGHEIAVSPVQLAAAFQSLANGGSYLEPAVVAEVIDPDGGRREPRARSGRQVFDPVTARTVREMLVGAVDRGTGTAAALDGYSVAGKTSTARWELDQARYTSSFAGFAPAIKPRLLVVVVVDQPTGPVHSGGKVAAPAAGEILGRSLRYLGVHMDRMDPSIR